MSPPYAIVSSETIKKSTLSRFSKNSKGISFADDTIKGFRFVQTNGKIADNPEALYKGFGLDCLLETSLDSKNLLVTNTGVIRKTHGLTPYEWQFNKINPQKQLQETVNVSSYFKDGESAELLKNMTKDDLIKSFDELEKIKTANKKDFAKLVKKTNGIDIDPESIFDVQVKRLHEYKRQNLNALNILAQYLAIKANPNGNFVPKTYIFGAKAAPGYFMAKKIINLICSIADLVNNDPDIKGRLKVVYMEDYNVTLAEKLMPAADISEQISLAGTEASGTGNMKLMLNGAITLGTLDGANVEIHEAVGDENIFLFGMTTPEVEDLKRRGYHPDQYYHNNPELHRILDMINSDIAGKAFREVGFALINSDPYMALADYADYRRVQEHISEVWKDRETWNRMSLMNIAGAGRFAADRAIKEYADNIWFTSPVE